MSLTSDNCTTVTLGIPETIVQGPKIESTTVVLDEPSTTVFLEDCDDIGVETFVGEGTVVTTDTFEVQTTSGGTEIVLSDAILTVESGGEGSIDPCGRDQVLLSYTGEQLTSVDKDGFVVSLQYTGDLLTTIVKPDCTYDLNYTSGLLTSVVKR